MLLCCKTGERLYLSARLYGCVTFHGLAGRRFSKLVELCCLEPQRSPDGFRSRRGCSKFRKSRGPWKVARSLENTARSSTALEEKGRWYIIRARPIPSKSNAELIGESNLSDLQVRMGSKTVMTDRPRRHSQINVIVWDRACM